MSFYEFNSELSIKRRYNNNMRIIHISRYRNDEHPYTLIAPSNGGNMNGTCIFTGFIPTRADKGRISES